ncbi:MAG: YdiU family protein [Mariprofundaceae bacterium]|nr:YdiU family protein [Mariprofundaceae bacterium]
MTPIRFDNSYAALPERFYSRIHPERAPKPELIRLNEPLARELGIDIEWLKPEAGLAMPSGSRMPESSEPIAMAYAGHQFGGWVPQLGDGRAHLIGELIDVNGKRFDVHLKGSGRTPFSRRGDGKAALGPVLREYIVSEAFAALGIPSTRTLAAVLTGEDVYRETTLPGAVLTRVAQSHVRVGTFQYFASRNDMEAVAILADYVIDRHFPELQEAKNPYLALFEAVAMRQAKLIAQWMGVGFIHGVMNTDNMQLVGETIDFGPCAFMDSFHPDKVFSSIDQHGRYAWSRQPEITGWNLARLAETLLPLLHPEAEEAIKRAEGVLERFSEAFRRHYTEVFSNKLGLSGVEADAGFIEATLSTMAANEVDFTRFFRRLTQLGVAGEGGEKGPLLELFSDMDAGNRWLEQWLGRWNSVEDREGRLNAMQQANPIYIARNHRVEQVIEAAINGNFAPFHELVDLLSRPFDAQPGSEGYELPPTPDEEVRQTFCGT